MVCAGGFLFSVWVGFLVERCEFEYLTFHEINSDNDPNLFDGMRSFFFIRQFAQIGFVLLLIR
jgi:hypothetical protein